MKYKSAYSMLKFASHSSAHDPTSPKQAMHEHKAPSMGRHYRSTWVDWVFALSSLVAVSGLVYAVFQMGGVCATFATWYCAVWALLVVR